VVSVRLLRRGTGARRTAGGVGATTVRPSIHRSSSPAASSR